MRRLILGLSAFLFGCTITQEVDPITAPPTSEVCIIENPAVRKGFLETYESALAQRGYRVRLLSKGAYLDGCVVTSTYVARWSWDLGLYMSYARIMVFTNGQQVGEALYDARSGSGSMRKFIDAEPKIRELVDELFPARSVSQPSS